MAILYAMPKIYCIGDSHVSFFAGSDRIQKDWPTPAEQHLALFQASKPHTDDADDGVSVVLCCYNSVGRLPETLRHLSMQRLPSGCQWEVLLVDNASQDDTAFVASGLWEDLGRPAPLRIVHEPIPGLSSARNAGIRNACYEYVILCDDDNWLAPDNLLNTLCNKLANLM
jgi:hypothetical protein